MRNLNYVNDADFLKEWFELQNMPVWNLYRGFHSRMPERDVIYKQRGGEMEMKDSWELLWRMINANSVGGGKFTVYIPVYDGNKAATLHFGVGLQTASPGWTTPNVAGMPGMPPIMGGYDVQGSIERAVANAETNWKKDRQIEDLEAALDYKAGIWEVLIEKIREVDPNTIVPVAVQGLSNLFQPRPGVQLHGVQTDHQAPPPNHEQQEGYVYHQEVLVPWLNSIRQHFSTDEEFWQFMNAVSAKFNGNPEMFKNLVHG